MGGGGASREVGDPWVSAKTLLSLPRRSGSNGSQRVNGLRSPSSWVSSCPPPISSLSPLHPASEGPYMGIPRSVGNMVVEAFKLDLSHS